MKAIASAVLMVQLLTCFCEDYDIEVLPDGCVCRDWYGSCREAGSRWTDDDTWVYSCTKQSDNVIRRDAVNNLSRWISAKLVACSWKGREIPLNTNITIDQFWHNCVANGKLIKLESEPHCVDGGVTRRVNEEYRNGRFHWLCLETGRWVKGCYFTNETHSDVLLRIGESSYNGLVKHSCERYKDNPGLIQYTAEVRKDVPIKHPTNKGINKNLPEPADLRITSEVKPWLHENHEAFIAADDKTWTRIRYLNNVRT